MKLQISFDTADLQSALEIAHKVEKYVDILEVGTLLIYSHGVTALKKFREEFPKKTILSDTKIVDRGRDAVSLFAREGSDWLTVMAGTNKNVIHAACSNAHEHGKRVMLDLIDSQELGQSALEAKNLGADALLLHQPFDTDEPLIFLDKWDMIRGNTDLPIYVLGRINRDNVQAIVNLNPNGIIVGRSITQAENPEEEARYFFELCNK
jgi:3-hexulose-6-phosphate synthase